MADKKSYRLEIPSSQNFLAKADKFLEGHLKEHGIDAEITLTFLNANQVP